MGLFFNNESCPICGKPVSGLFKVRIKDKVALCQNCGKKVAMDSSMLPFTSLTDLKDHLQYREENEKKFNQFTVSREIKTSFGNVIRVDDAQKLWYYGTKKPTNPPLFRFDEIINYELSENGNIVSSGGTSQAIAGGLLFGGVGAIVGSVSGKKTENVIKSINLHISLSNEYIKSVNIEFLNNTDCKSGSFSHKLYKDIANNVISLLDSMCKEVETAQISATQPTTISSADEIMKYKQLLDCGAITPEEFEAKKKQLIGIC